MASQRRQPHRTDIFAIADDGAPLWVDSRGSGIHLALAHGGPGLWDYLEPLALLLEPFATVHRWDQRGSGRSHPGGPYTIDRFLADMDSVRAHVGAERWIAGGHSWGAVLALLYALRYPEHSLGVLYVAGTGLEWHRWKSLHNAEFERRLGPEPLQRLRETTDPIESNRLRWSCDFVSFEAARPHVERMLAHGFRVNRNCNRALNADIDSSGDRLVRGLDDLSVPLLIIQGAADPRPAACCDSLAARARTSTRALLQRAGHFPWVEQPESFLSIVRHWIGSGAEISKRVPDGLVREVAARIRRQAWGELTPLLHPYLHWTCPDGRLVRGRKNVLAHLARTPAGRLPRRYEIRDGQIYRWLEQPTD